MCLISLKRITLVSVKWTSSTAAHPNSPLCCREACTHVLGHLHTRVNTHTSLLYLKFLIPETFTVFFVPPGHLWRCFGNPLCVSSNIIKKYVVEKIDGFLFLKKFHSHVFEYSDYCWKNSILYNLTFRMWLSLRKDLSKVTVKYIFESDFL